MASNFCKDLFHDFRVICICINIFSHFWTSIWSPFSICGKFLRKVFGEKLSTINLPIFCLSVSVSAIGSQTLHTTVLELFTGDSMGLGLGLRLKIVFKNILHGTVNVKQPLNNNLH